MGGPLGTMFARSGHDVTFSYSRSEQKLVDLARGAGDPARAGTLVEAAREADLVVLAVHWLEVSRNVLGQAGTLKGKTVVSCCNPVPGSSHCTQR